MLKLIRFELYKLITNKKLYVLMGVIIGASVLIGYGIQLINTIEDIPSKITMNGQSYPIFLLMQLTKEVLPIILIILLGGLFSDEYREGTLKYTLLKPVKRNEVLAAKLTVVAAATAVFLGTAFVSGYLVGPFIFGWGDSFSIPGSQIVMSTSEGIIRTVFAYGLTALPLAAFSIIILFLSILISSSGLVLGAGIGLLMMFNMAQGFVERIRPYIITNYFTIGSMLLETTNAAGLLQGIGTVMVYLVIFLGGAALAFKRKDILY